MNKLRKILLKIIYSFAKLIPVRDRVVLASNSSTQLRGNMKYIYNELQRQNYCGEIIYLLYDTTDGIVGKIGYMFQMIKAIYYLATSRFFIVDDYYYPIYIIEPKKETTIIQVWHACGAFKKFGYSVIDKSFGATQEFVETVKIHSNYSYVLVSSKFVADKYAEAFDMNKDNIISIGIPRTDLFFDKARIESFTKKFYDKYQYLKDKKIILYAPTFRGADKFKANNDDTMPDFEKIGKNLSDEYHILLKLHPFISSNYKVSENLADKILDLSDYEDINELMLISDILITDYSSVVFEYSILERPMIFYAPDLGEYADERDFYYDYETFVPGPIVENTDQLLEIIDKGNFDIDKISLFKERFFDHLDSQSSKRFVEKIILGEKDRRQNQSK